jgi:hypothetical protein
MTGSKTAILIGLSLLFDAIKFMCTQLWFFGPFFIGLVGSAVTGGGWFGVAVGTIITTALALTAGAALEMMGLVLAMAIGIFGWLVVLSAMFSFRMKPFHNRSFLKTMLGMLVTEIPFVDALPSFTISVWMIIREEKKADRAALAEYKAAEAARLAREQRWQQLQQRALEEQAANDIEAQEAEAEAEDEAAEEELLEESGTARAARSPLLGPPSLIPENTREAA